MALMIVKISIQVPSVATAHKTQGLDIYGKSGWFGNQGCWLAIHVFVMAFVFWLQSGQRSC